MKVNGIGRSGPANRTRRTEKNSAKSGSDFASQIESGNETRGGSAVGGSGPIASVDALLSLQELSDEQLERRRAADHGNKLLDLLDEVRLGLLLGRIPTHRLDDLLKMVEQRRATVNDPAIEAILTDIETRASVELAKLGRFG